MLSDVFRCLYVFRTPLGRSSNFHFFTVCLKTRGEHFENLRNAHKALAPVEHAATVNEPFPGEHTLLLHTHAEKKITNLGANSCDFGVLANLGTLAILRTLLRLSELLESLELLQLLELANTNFTNSFSVILERNISWRRLELRWLSRSPQRFE